MSLDSLRDVRSPEVYKQNVEAGIKNQYAFLNKIREEFGHDYQVCRKEVYTEDFDSVEGHTPDAFIYALKWELCEVKVTSAIIGVTVDLKQNQIDRLVRRHGMIVYANKTEFGFASAADVVKISGHPISSKAMGGKMCYHCLTMGVDGKPCIWHWRRFKTPFNIVEYRKEPVDGN